MLTAVQQDAAPPWWNRLRAESTLFSDPAWLDLFARSRGEPAPWWFGVGDPEPSVGLRATIVESGARKSMNPYRWLFERTPYHDRAPADPGTAPRPDAWFPALLCSYPGLDAYPVGDLGRLGELLSGVIDWAHGHGVRTVAIGFVQPELTSFTDAATAAGFTALPTATRANLPIAGRTAEEVFASWSGQQRNNLRRLRRRLASVSVVVLPSPLAAIDDLVDLRCAHAAQHGKRPDPAEERSWLEPLLTTFPDRITVFGAYLGNDLRGFSLFVDDDRWWNAFAVARLDEDVYFELMYHTPIEHAATHGIAELSYGYGTGEAKRRRGCRLVSVPTWYHATDPAVRRWLSER